MEGADSSRNGRGDGLVSRPGDGLTAWSRSWPPGWTESTRKFAFTWRKRSQAMAVLTRTWGALRRETRRCVATAIPLWLMRSTHSSSAQSGACQGRLSDRQWVLSSLLTRWSLWYYSLNESGRSSSHSSHLWWKRESSMGVGRVITGRASRNRIGAYAPGHEFRANGVAASVRRGSFPSPGWCNSSVEPNGRFWFLVLTGMPSFVLGESCTTSIKDFAIFSSSPKKKEKKISWSNQKNSIVFWKILKDFEIS